MSKRFYGIIETKGTKEALKERTIRKRGKAPKKVFTEVKVPDNKSYNIAVDALDRLEARKELTKVAKSMGGTLSFIGVYK